MKKNITTTIVFFLAFLSLTAQQVPYGFNYQSIVRDGIGLPVVNTQVKLRISVIQTNVAGTLVYQEEQTQTTNQFGLVNLVIGKGTVVGGSVAVFGNINWSADNFFIQVEASNAGSWVSLGITQFQSVPYAFTTDNTLKLQNQKVSAAIPTAGQFLKYNGLSGQWEPGNLAGANGGTVVTVTAIGPLLISGDGGLNPEISMLQAGPGQDGYLSGADWAIFNKKLDVLSIAGGDMSGTYKAITVTGIQNKPVNLSGINTGDVLQYNGTAFVPYTIPAGIVPTSITGINNLTIFKSGQSFTIPGLTTNTLGVTVNGNDIQIATATGISYGLLSPADYATFLNKLSTATGFGGDVSGTYSSLTIKSISGVGITVSGASVGQALIYNGTGFSPQAIPGTQITTFTGINGATVTGSGFSYTIDGQSLSAGSNVTISGNAINVASPTPYTPLTSIAGLNGITVSGTNNNFTITGPASVVQQYTSITGVGTTVLGFGTLDQTIIGQNLQAGSGIVISGNQIINSSPNVPLTLTGSGIISVSGANNDYTISGIAAQTLTLTGGNGITVLGIGSSQTVVGQSFVAGNGISITGNTITGLTTNAWLLGGNTVSGVTALGTTNNFDLPFVTNNTEAMRITSQGDVLVNSLVSLAGARFEINEAATSGRPSMAIMGGVGNSASLVFGRGTIDGGIGVAGSLAFLSSLSNPGDIIVRAVGVGNNLILSSKGLNGKIIFSTFNNTTETEKMSILNDGTIRIASLTSTGIGYVVADAAGNLSITTMSATSIIGVAIPVIQSGNIFTIDGTNLLQTTSLYGGDVSGTFNSLSIKSIAGIGITTTGATLGQALIYDGVGFNPQTIPANQATTLTGINGATVTGSGFSYTLDGQNLTAGSNVTISGNVISVASPTPLTSLTGANGITVSGIGNNFTITSPIFTSQSTTLTGINGATVTGSGFSYTVDGQNLIAGSNVTISGNAISVASPTPLTSLTGANGITVSGIGNNFTITSPIFTSQSTTLTGINGATVTGSGFNYTIDGQNLTAGSNVTISGNAISVASPTPLTSLTGANGITVSGVGNNFTITSPVFVSQATSVTGTNGVTVAGMGFNLTVGGVAQNLTSNTASVSVSGLNIEIGTASGIGFGLLSPADWQTFNNKLSQAVTIFGDNLTTSVTGFYPAYTVTGLAKGSQWNTTGTGIYYSGGNVGIGSSNPTDPLTVQSASTPNLAFFESFDPAGSTINVYNGGVDGARIKLTDASAIFTLENKSSIVNFNVFSNNNDFFQYNILNSVIGINPNGGIVNIGKSGVPSNLSVTGTTFTKNLVIGNMANGVLTVDGFGNVTTTSLTFSTTPTTLTGMNGLSVAGSGFSQTIIGQNFIGSNGIVVSSTGINALTIINTIPGLSLFGDGVNTSVTGSNNNYTVLGIGQSSQWVTTTSGKIYYGGGKVGIGTVVPSNDLHIYNSSTGSSLKIESSSSADFAEIVLQSDAQTWTTTLHGTTNGSGNIGEYLLYDNTAGITRFRVLPSTGNVVIGGFAVPANEKLTVEGNATILGIGYADAFSATNLTLSGVGYFATIIGTNLAGAAGSVITVDGAGKMGIGSVVASQWLTSGNNISYATGNVGVGSTAFGNSRFYVSNTSSTVNNIGMAIDFQSYSGAGSTVEALNVTLSSINKDRYGIDANVNENATGGDANFSIGISSSVVLAASSSGSNKYLFKGDYPFISSYGSATRYGLYVTNETSNYLSNKLGIGTAAPNQTLAVVGNSSVTGIGYFGTITGNNLIGSAGSIVTVNGLGQLGLGPLPGSVTSWQSTLTGTTFTVDNIAIGTTTGNGAKLKVAGDVSGAGMVLASDKFPVSVAVTGISIAGNELITQPVYIPAGTNTIEIRVKVSVSGGTGQVQAKIDSNTPALSSTFTSQGYQIISLDVSGISGWHDLTIEGSNTITDASTALSAYTVVIKN